MKTCKMHLAYYNHLATVIVVNKQMAVLCFVKLPGYEGPPYTSTPYCRVQFLVAYVAVRVITNMIGKTAVS